MGRFFDKFPTIQYSLSDKKYPDYETVTNLLFRTAFVREAIENTSGYMKYNIRDGDTPEILASKIYGDPEAHWVILYANEILDPQYNWPMTSNVFYKYIADKYRSMAQLDVGNTLSDNQVIAWTQNLTNPGSVHHYEKVVKQENQTTSEVSETRYIINKTKLTDNSLSVPYDYYDALPDEQSVTPIDLTLDGQTVIQTIYRNSVTYFDYENDLNESRRSIRILKQDYYNRIMAEFGVLTNTNVTVFLRKVF